MNKTWMLDACVMIEKQNRVLSVADGRFSYKLAGKDLGWDRIGFTLGTSHGTGQAGFEYYMQTGAEPFQCTDAAKTGDGVELRGRYNAPGLEETITLRLLANGALRVARCIVNTGKVSLVVRSAGAGDGGKPVFSDNHIWRARYCHMDNVRTEKFPWCRPEYPYVRPLPKSDTVLGHQESQAIPALLLTNDTYSQLLIEGQLRQDRSRAQWTLAAGAGAPVRTYDIQWSMHQGGFELQAGARLDLEPMYYEILEDTHPQDAWAGYIDAVTAENRLLSADDILLSKAFYCSWNYGVFHDINEEKLLKTAQFVAANMPEVKHFLIDGGWQSQESGINCPNCANFYLPEGQWHDSERFPNGMKAMAGRIREAGLTPAIWWTPSVGLHTRLAQEHPEWLAKDSSGNVYRIVNYGYLDYSLKPVQEYLHKIFTILFKEWGYEAMKMDFWSQSVESEQIRYATGTGIQWRDWLLSTIRSYLPPDGFLMTCVAVSMGNPFLGKGASTYRCGIDVGACQWHEHVTASAWTLPLLAVPGNRTCLLNVDGAGWNMALSDAENLHRLTFAFITMGSLEVDGRLEELPASRIALLNRLFADIDRGHAVRCPDEDAFTGRPLPKCLYVDYPHDSRTARRGIAKHIALFNWTDKPQYTGYTAADLGLSGQVTARDFWTGETVELPEGNVFALLPPRSARLVEVLEYRT
jgi:hypothetical protein